MPPAQDRFVPGLHGARGIASILVVLDHTVTALVRTDPAHTLAAFLIGSAGRTMPELLFVLSGTVLSMSLRRHPAGGDALRRYLAFVAQRVFRLLPLVAVAVVLGTVYCNLVAPRAVVPPEAASLAIYYYRSVDPARFVAALFGYSALPDPPLWSIFVQMMATVLLPLMVWFTRRRVWLVLGLVLCIGVAALPLPLQYRAHIFLVNFYVGACIPVLIGPIRRAAARLSFGAYWALLGALLLALFELARLLPDMGEFDWRLNTLRVGVLGPIIALLLAAPQHCQAFVRQPWRFLGDVSFGVYVLHFPLMMLSLDALHALVPPAWLIAHPGPLALLLSASVLVLTLPLAWLAYHYVELPAVRLGRRIAQGVTRPAGAAIRTPIPQPPPAPPS